VPEAECAKALEAEGWEVMKRGWPDFLAVKDGKVRMIEVKPRADRKLSPAQARVAEVLALLGVTVELWSPSGEEGQV
jgi:Holliday junction resolvase